MRTIAKILVAAAAAASLAGCVSQSDFDKLVASSDAAIKAAAQEAAAAKAAADSAGAAAASASNAASAAQSAANQAAASAQAAKACCDANSEKIDRAFQKSMGK